MCFLKEAKKGFGAIDIELLPGYIKAVLVNNKLIKYQLPVFCGSQRQSSLFDICLSLILSAERVASAWVILSSLFA